MAFQFSLHAVLRARTVVEEHEERILQKILVEIAQCTQEIAHLDSGMARGNTLRAESVLQPILGRALHGQYGEMHELKRVRELLVSQVSKLEELKAMQIVVYNTARQNRELLSEMRITKRDAYHADLSRREQSTLDDNFIARRSLA